MKARNTITLGGAGQYIAGQPKKVRRTLNALRSAIQESAPRSKETVSYFEMPGYFYEGYDYNDLFAWFSYKKPYVRLHVRPPVIEDHKEELVGYGTTRAVISFPANKDLPVKIVKKLVKASIKVMKAKKE